MTNLAIAEKFSKEFNLRIAPQTLSGWLKDKFKYLNIEEPDDFNIMEFDESNTNYVRS